MINVKFKKNGEVKERKHVNEKEEKVGEASTYWKNGLIKEHFNYKDGEKSGMVLKYNKEGKYVANGLYQNGKLHGDFTVYLDGENIKGRYENGKLHGEYKITSSSDEKIKLEGQYLEGKREGEWKSYNKEGKLEKIINYVKNEIKEIKEQIQQKVRSRGRVRGRDGSER